MPGTRARRQPDALRLRQQMIRSQVAINLCNQRRAGLVANQHRNLGICQPALAALRYKVAPQPVRCDMPHTEDMAADIHRKGSTIPMVLGIQIITLQFM